MRILLIAIGVLSFFSTANAAVTINGESSIKISEIEVTSEGVEIVNDLGAIYKINRRSYENLDVTAGELTRMIREADKGLMGLDLRLDPDLSARTFNLVRFFVK